jgi:hypothetical protein
MTMLVTADDKGRVILRGTRKGQRLLVKQEQDGWWVMPVPDIERPKPVSRNRREWGGSKLSLNEHLQRLADHGLRIQEAGNSKQPVPPCQF